MQWSMLVLVYGSTLYDNGELSFWFLNVQQCLSRKTHLLAPFLMFGAPKSLMEITKRDTNNKQERLLTTQTPKTEAETVRKATTWHRQNLVQLRRQREVQVEKGELKREEKRALEQTLQQRR